MVLNNTYVPGRLPSFSQAVAALFVRHPVPGRVKTRLARDLGDEPACALYRAMVADCIATIKGCGLPLFLFHDGRDAAGLPPEWIAAADTVFCQEGDCLGARMAAAFEQSFAAGAPGVILVGSDIPGIDAELLRSALESIRHYDAVLAPALDGGYCLVASEKGRFDRRILTGIPWGTSRVLAATIAACIANDLSYGLLEPRQDIDTLEDLKSYCSKPSKTASATNAWLVAGGFLHSMW